MKIIDENGILREATAEETEWFNENHKVADNLPPPQPTDTDRIEAQVMYTALMTDTLLDEEV